MSVDFAYLDDGLRVASLNQRLSQAIATKQRAMQVTLDESIRSSERLLADLGITVPAAPLSLSPGAQLGPIRTAHAAKTWAQLLGEAGHPVEGAGFEDLLTPAEIRQVNAAHDEIGKELDWSGSLTKFDIALAVVAGSIAGLIDVFLVAAPQSPGFLGAEASPGGWLSNKVKERFGEIFPTDSDNPLADRFKTPYDPSTSANLGQKVEGLYPGSHRYQSLGHDPVLGFFFGIRDILCGEFTAISSAGELIRQTNGAPFMPDANFVLRIYEALKIHLGHLASDVATPAGLPAPLTPLLAFLQCGKIGDKEHTIAEVGRAMYRKGYDARHFAATSIPVLVSETIVRLGHVVQSLNAGKSLMDSVPLASNLAVRRKLIIAHGVASAVNAGKVYFTGNPMGISWAQIMALTRYLVPELRYLIFGKDAEKARLVEEVIWNGYVDIYASATKLDESAAGPQLVMDVS